MHLITTLGTGKYKVTAYRWGDRPPITTHLFAQAATEWLNPQKVTVLLTTDAANSDNWQQLRKSLVGRCTLNEVAIPVGHTEEELWQVQQKVLDEVTVGETVALDVTHGFRILPITMLLAAAFLRASETITLQHVLYGALQADETKAVVIDLKPFLELLDWANAARFLASSGDSRAVGDLLRHYDHDKRHRPHGTAAARLGSNLTNLSQALALNRPHDVAANATKTLEALQSLPVESGPRSAAANILRKNLEETYSTITESNLQGTLKLVQWYIRYGRYLQAVTLAGEWIITFAGISLGRPVDRRKDREIISGELSRAERATNPKADSTDPPKTPDLDLTDQRYAHWIEAWRSVSNLRNDLAHCGYRESRRNLSTITSEAEAVVGTLQALLHSSSLSREEP
jgi:CRISPR-associated DxTHG motif protein